MKNYFLFILIFCILFADTSKAQSTYWEKTKTSDYRGDGINTPLEIPIIVVLWQNNHFTGTKRIILRDEPNLKEGWTKGAYCQEGSNFNDVTSSVAVQPGPDYEKWKARHGGQEPTVTLFVDWNYEGTVLIRMRAGTYSDLSKYGINDQISSIRFDKAGDNTVIVKDPDGTASTISPIPIVLRLHTASYLHDYHNGCGEADNAMTMIEYTNDISSQYGQEFNDNVSWVEVLKGPNWTANANVSFFKDSQSQNHGGSRRTYHAPVEADLVKDQFNDVLSSVLFNQ